MKEPLLRVSILSLFPEYFDSPLGVSILKRAIAQGILEVTTHDIRDWAEGKHKQVDERPFGGGSGMVLMPGPTTKAIRSVKRENSHVVYLSPQGSTLNAAKAEELSKKRDLILLCGHYEGVDQRVIDKEVDEEISIGDYVLTSGCLPAIVLLDAVSRFVPGVLGNSEAVNDSFANGALQGPTYTRPEEFEGIRVPEVLLSGHHAHIAKWRQERGREKTLCIRPDLIERRNYESVSTD